MRYTLQPPRFVHANPLGAYMYQCRTQTTSKYLDIERQLVSQLTIAAALGRKIVANFGVDQYHEGGKMTRVIGRLREKNSQHSGA